ncbi:hypothetical protein QVD17_38163 [Tagetes erecta]|uniref:Uncharacterized protein n=1 Tax=Tagetes erecta TaxID=13708 RepID=A0AAD8JXF0_TARER|nr:hypothetical protein QVD17_38163 [Tagetes erecta]
MSKILVSAYEDRKVEVEDEVTALEKNITSYLFAGIGDEWSVVFSIEGKIDVTRVLMESMRPGQYIHINVVLAWGHLLNHEELVKKLEKAAESPKEASQTSEVPHNKLFCTEIMLHRDTYDKSEHERFQEFTRHML